jgi:hypothetical protein
MQVITYTIKNTGIRHKYCEIESSNSGRVNWECVYGQIHMHLMRVVAWSLFFNKKSSVFHVFLCVICTKYMKLIFNIKVVSIFLCLVIVFKCNGFRRKLVFGMCSRSWQVILFNVHGFDTTLHETQMKLCHVGLDFLTAVAMKRSTVFWVVTPLHSRK